MSSGKLKTQGRPKSLKNKVTKVKKKVIIKPFTEPSKAF